MQHQSPVKKTADASAALPEWLTRSVRFPPDLLQRVEASALEAQHRRSVNHHILWLLEWALTHLPAQ